MERTVEVDTDACISCGLCVSVAPEVFQFVSGKSFAYNPQGAAEEKIQECIDGCPVSAISWQNR